MRIIQFDQPRRAYGAAKRLGLLVVAFMGAGVVSSQTVESPPPDLLTFDRDLDVYYSLLKAPGMAVGVARGDSLIYFRGLGYADVEERTPITPNTIFWIASVTKTFTAVALKQMEEQSQVSLEDELVTFPNKYFDARRIEPGVTIGHVISHTSEIRPYGSLFVYNGGRYNLVFNAFDAVAPAEPDSDVIRPFTRTIEDRIIAPLRLDHTVTRVASGRFEALRPYVVTPYAHEEGRGFVPSSQPLGFDTSYPATGMLSSVHDLIRYSHALTSEELISRDGYADLTTPFYEDQDGPSVYGQGWFTSSFEGVKLHWAFGYGDVDAALLLRVPDRDLTLVMLSNSAMPSATTLLGYGNPMISPLAASFVKCFILHDRGPVASIDYTSDLAGVEERLAEATAASGSRVYAEEAFAYAVLMKLLPTDLFDGQAQAWGLLSVLYRRFPDLLDPQRVEAFDLLARFDEPAALSVGARLAAAYMASNTYHPIKSFYAGRLYMSLGDTAQALHFYSAVADSASFLEQPVKHHALLALGRHYARIDPERAERYLEALIQYKEMIGVRDDEYEEATTLLDSAKTRRRGLR